MARSHANHYNFQQCCNCGVVICEESTLRHQQQCASKASTVPVLKAEPNASSVKTAGILQHPYIADGILHGIVDELNLTEKLGKLPSSAALMHPTTMKLCSIGVCESVVIQSSQVETLHVAYPCSDVKKMSVVFVKPHKVIHKLKTSVKVSSYSGETSVAEKVIISVSCKVNFHMDDFKKFVLELFCDTFISRGLLLKCHYMDTDCTVMIKDISGHPIDHVSMHHSSNERTMNDEFNSNLLSLVTSEFSNLSLDSTANKSLRCEQEFKSPNGVLPSSLSLESMDSLSLYSTPYSSFSECRSSCSFRETSDKINSLLNASSTLKEHFYATVASIVEIENEDVNPKVNESSNLITYESIGGLCTQMKILKEYLHHFLSQDRCFSHGLLFLGPSGTGKTLVAKAISNEYGMHFINVSMTRIFLNAFCDKDHKLKYIFKEAYTKAPSIIFLDELDLLCEMFPNNKDGVISTLSSLIDELLVVGKKVLIIAAANELSLIDNSLKSRLEIEIKFDIPNVEERLKILQKLLEHKSHSITDQKLRSLSESAHGFTGFNMYQMCMAAEFEACLGKVNGSNLIKDEKGDSPLINSCDMEHQLSRIKPQILKSNTSFSFHKVQWKDVGGMHEVKAKLKQVVELPLKFPEIFLRFDVTPPCGVLLYGPPGCSKTMIAKALATESGLNFIPVKGPELFSKWVGESEKSVRDLFKKARDAAPCIIFFDEIDALVGERGSSDGSDAGKRVVTQLLTEVDGIEQLKGVIIIAATNRPDILDPAMLRPGRLDHLIYVPLPDAEARMEIFQLKFEKMPISDDVSIQSLVESTEGYSGAEIVAVCHEAALLSVSEEWPNIVEDPLMKTEHFKEALKIVLPRIPSETIQFYESFSANISSKK